MSDFQPTIPAAPEPAQRTRSLAESPALAALAAQLLRTPSMLAAMDAVELACVVTYLKLASFGASTALFREGDASSTGYLLLILSGEVHVEATPFGGSEALEISVLGPGHVIGEMGLLDGAPRSTTCTAVTAVHAAVLSRQAYERMLAEHPVVAAKLMVALAQRIAERLRALGEQLGLYAKLARDARHEQHRLGNDR